jgi:hypothetical protein
MVVIVLAYLCVVMWQCLRVILLVGTTGKVNSRFLPFSEVLKVFAIPKNQANSLIFCNPYQNNVIL